MPRKRAKKSRADKGGPILVSDVEAKEMQARVDAFVNSLSGFHGENDPMGVMSFQPIAANQVSSATLDIMYRRNWATRAVIETFPEDATREGFLFICDDTEVKKWVEKKLETLNFLRILEEGLTLARLYGGSILVLGAVDGQDISTPLNTNRISEVFMVESLDRYQLMVNRGQEKQIGTGSMKVESYGTVNSDEPIHISRTIRLDGDYLPRRMRDSNDGWHASVMESVFEAIKYFDVALHSGSLTLQDFITKILKMPNLGLLLAKKGGEAAVRARIKQAFVQLSMFGITTIQNDEEFKKIQTPIAGLPKMMDFFSKILSAASKIPQTRLFGEQLGTLSGAEATVRVYHDRVKLFQEKRLRQAIQIFVELLLLSDEAPNGAASCTWSIKFRSLWQMTLLEELDARKKQAEIDQIYIQNGVLHEDEVANSRFGTTEEFSFDYSLDEDMRAAVPPATEEDDLEITEVEQDASVSDPPLEEEVPADA